MTVIVREIVVILFVNTESLYHSFKAKYGRKVNYTKVFASFRKQYPNLQIHAFAFVPKYLNPKSLGFLNYLLSDCTSLHVYTSVQALESAIENAVKVCVEPLQILGEGYIGAEAVYAKELDMSTDSDNGRSEGIRDNTNTGSTH